VQTTVFTQFTDMLWKQFLIRMQREGTDVKQVISYAINKIAGTS